MCVVGGERLVAYQTASNSFTTMPKKPKLDETEA